MDRRSFIGSVFGAAVSAAVPVPGIAPIEDVLLPRGLDGWRVVNAEWVGRTLVEVVEMPPPCSAAYEFAFLRDAARKLGYSLKED